MPSLQSFNTTNMYKSNTAKTSTNVLMPTVAMEECAILNKMKLPAKINSSLNHVYCDNSPLRNSHFVPVQFTLKDETASAPSATKEEDTKLEGEATNPIS